MQFVNRNVKRKRHSEKHRKKEGLHLAGKKNENERDIGSDKDGRTKSGWTDSRELREKVGDCVIESERKRVYL